MRELCVSRAYWASKDLFLAQRCARHLSPLTTTVDTHRSDRRRRIQPWSNRVYPDRETVPDERSSSRAFRYNNYRTS